MKSVTVYYEEQKESCRKCAELFSAYDGVVCRKISECRDEKILYEENERVGFLFESEREKVPAAVLQVIRRLIMNKTGKCFVYVTGGSRELTALKKACLELESRGYHSMNAYSRYFFQKYHMDPKEIVLHILENLEKKDGIVPELAARKDTLTTVQMRQALHQEFKQYKKYRKNRRRVQK